MKIFIIIVTVSFLADAFALTTEQTLKGLKYAKDCAKQHIVPLEDFMKLKEGDFVNYSSEKHQCLIQCFLEKSGFFKDGQLQENIVLEKLSKNYDKKELQSVVSTCKNEKGANDCETAFKMFQCGFRNKAGLRYVSP